MVNMSKKRKSRKQLKREKKELEMLLKSSNFANRENYAKAKEAYQRVVELEADVLRRIEVITERNDDIKGLQKRLMETEAELLIATITVEKIRDALLDVRSEIASGFNNAAEQLATSGEASLKAIDEIVETETQWISPPWAETSDNPNLGPESFRTSWDEKE